MLLWTKVKFGFWLVLATVIAFGWFYIGRLEAEAINAQLEATMAQQTISSLEDNILENQIASTQREMQCSILTEAQETLIDELESVYKMDEEAGAWADDALPILIVDRLR